MCACVHVNLLSLQSLKVPLQCVYAAVCIRGAPVISTPIVLRDVRGQTRASKTGAVGVEVEMFHTSTQIPTAN